nr:helix-turn-helix domain-containing protein [Flavobacterium sp. N1718]
METIVDFTVKDAKKIAENFLAKKETGLPLCPVKDIMHTLGDKWSVLVMMTLGTHETLRFNEIRHAVDGISQKMLTVTLRELESFGMVTREVFSADTTEGRIYHYTTGAGVPVAPEGHA